MALEIIAAPAPVTLVAHTGITSRSATLTVTPVTPSSPIVSLALTPSPVAPGGTITGFVTLSQAAPDGGMIVNFKSSNPAVLPTPASLVVPPGATTASFSAVPLDDNSLFWGPISLVLQAQTGNVLRQAGLTVASLPEPGPLALGNPQNAFTSTQGGTSGNRFIPLNAVAQTTATITIVNTNPALIIPASVSVQAGSWTASVPWSAYPVPSLTTGTATVSLNGFSASDALSVTASPSPSIQSLSIPLVSPTQTFSSGDTLTGTVTLGGPAYLGGMVVTLASDTPAAVQVPPSVTVPTAGTGATFSVVAGPVSGPTPVNISATLPGFAPVTEGVWCRQKKRLLVKGRSLVSPEEAAAGKGVGKSEGLF